MGQVVFRLFFCVYRPVVQLVERRSPKPKVGGSSPSWPAIALVKFNRANMGNNVQGQASSLGSLDMPKWLVVVTISAAGIYGNSHFANEYSVYTRSLLLLLMAGVAIFMALQTTRGIAFMRLVKESRAEIRRVVWPTRKEATQTTLIVAAFVFVMALILWGVDWALNQIISLIIG